MKKIFFMFSLALILFLSNTGTAVAAGCFAYDATGHHAMKAVFAEEVGIQGVASESGVTTIYIYDIYRMECSYCGYQDGSTKKVYVGKRDILI